MADAAPHPGHGTPTTASAAPGSTSLAARPSRGIEALILAGLLAYTALLWIWGVGRLDISGSMEGSRALVPQQMMQTGDYVVPRRGTELYLVKPPLFYWGVVLTSQWTGRVTVESVRLVSALAAMAILLVVYAAVRRVFGWKTGVIAAFSTATCPLALEGATSGMVNMLLALGVTLSLVGAFFMLEARRGTWIYACVCGLGVAMGFMTKGPVVLLFTAPILLVYAGFARGGRLARSWRKWVPYFAIAAFAVWSVSVVAPHLGAPAAAIYAIPLAMLVYFAAHGSGRLGRAPAWAWLLAVGVAVALSVPWPLLAVHSLGLDTLWSALQSEMWTNRVETVGSSNRGPLWLYALYFPGATLPYSLLVPLTFAVAYRADTTDPRRRLILLAQCWILASIVLFSSFGASRRLRYLIPAFPAVPILAADVLWRAASGRLEARLSGWVRWIELATVGVLCTAPIVLVALWLHAVRGVSVWVVATGAAAVAGAAAGVWLWRRGRHLAAPLVGFALVMLGAKIYIHFGVSELRNLEDSPRPAAAAILSSVPPGDQLLTFGLPTIATTFYLDAPPYQPFAADPERLAGSERVYVCGSARDLEGFAPPRGFTSTEVARVPYPNGELLLLRLDREAETETAGSP